MRPRHWPAMIRTSAADVAEPRHEAGGVLPQIPFEAVRHVHLLGRRPLAQPMGNTPPHAFQLGGGVAERELEPVLTDHTRRRTQLDAARRQQWRRIANAERFEVSQEPFEGSDRRGGERRSGRDRRGAVRVV